MNYYAVVFLLHPPDLLRREPLFEGTNVCNSQENRVRTRCTAIANHYAIVKSLRRASLLRRSIFSTAGSFRLGIFLWWFRALLFEVHSVVLHFVLCILSSSGIASYHWIEKYYIINSETILDVNNHITFSKTNFKQLM